MPIINCWHKKWLIVKNIDMKKFLLSIFLFLLLFFVTMNFPIKKSEASQYDGLNGVGAIIECPEQLNYNINYRNIDYTIDNKLIKRLKNMGFNDKVICEYLFEDFNQNVDQLKEKINVLPTDSKFITKNGVLGVTRDIDGQSLVEEGLFAELVKMVENSKNRIVLTIEKEYAKKTYEDNLKLTNLRSAFETPITGVNQEGRINNIAVALKKFDGLVVLNGEKVSFNEIVGETTAENGFRLAKVIVNGEYADDFGGGVCQASTTLYNALLLADVDIIQANPHSLKVGYVWGGFDAMVSNGISDMVFQNNTGEDIVITTFCNDLECGVRIYGKELEYTIKRISEKVDFDSDLQPDISTKYISKLEYYKGEDLIKIKTLRRSDYKKLVTHSE